jgi:hypothetical protein
VLQRAEVIQQDAAARATLVAYSIAYICTASVCVCYGSSDLCSVLWPLQHFRDTTEVRFTGESLSWKLLFSLIIFCTVMYAAGGSPAPPCALWQKGMARSCLNTLTFWRRSPIGK